MAFAARSTAGSKTVKFTFQSHNREPQLSEALLTGEGMYRAITSGFCPVCRYVADFLGETDDADEVVCERGHWFHHKRRPDGTGTSERIDRKLW